MVVIDAEATVERVLSNAAKFVDSDSLVSPSIFRV